MNLAVGGAVRFIDFPFHLIVGTTYLSSMNYKKLLPFIFIVILAILAIGIRRCNNNAPTSTNKRPTQTRTTGEVRTPSQRKNFDRNVTELFFTKHAKCRMQCRHISQQEVRDILANGTINYNKSELDDPQGAAYALEGVTKDRQHVRIVFAPKQKHMSVVTVIDLENDYQCNCP